MNIYFDNSATTKPYDEVIEEVLNSMKNFYGNPSSLHKLGIKSEKELNKVRELISRSINSNKNEIFFTSGGSEGNNLAIKGIVKKGQHLITTKFEHQSVLKTFEKLEADGINVTYLNVDKKGFVSIEELKSSITKETSLVSIMFVNNEIGAIQNIYEIGKVIKENSTRAKFHVDAVQAYGKLHIDVKKLNIDLLTATGHKIHGPKGTGFIYIKKGLMLLPIINGGNQEFGFRAGTQNVPSIIGFGKALSITLGRIDENFEYVYELKKYFIEKISKINDIRINSPLNENYSPYILNISFRGIRGEVLLHLLEDENIFVSTGSACTSKSSGINGSYVIKALGLNDREIIGAIRFSFSVNNTKEEVDKTIEVLKRSLLFLRGVKV